MGLGGRSIWFARHCEVADSEIREQNGIVDADGAEDSSRILLLAEDVRVDDDQEQSDNYEAGDVAEHLACALPG